MKKYTAATPSDQTRSTSFIAVFLNEKVTEVDYVYRGTASPPEGKFNSGFVARGQNLDLSNHIKNWPSDSAYVSSSLSKEVAGSFAIDKSISGFVYEINPPAQGINVENHLYDDLANGRIKHAHFKKFLTEREVSVPFKIEPSNIKGAWQVETLTDAAGIESYSINSDFIPNPQYKPSTAVRLAQGAKVLGHAATAVGAGIDGYNLIQAYQDSQKSNNYQGFFKEGARIVSSWTAAVTMSAPLAEAGAIIGAGLGGPAGALIGGVGCGLVGSAIGYTGVSHMFNKIDSSKFTYQAENTKVEQKWTDTATIMESIIAKEPNTSQPDIKTIKENTEFLQSMGIVNGANQLQLLELSHDAHHKLNAILHENRKHHREIKSIYQENKNAQDAHEKEAKLREEKLNTFRSMESGFNVITQLGMATGNQSIAKIGAVGAAGVSIAANAAMLSGAIPGIALSGWGLMIPYAGIALAGLAIITTLFGKKKKKDDSMMKALHALSEQIDAFRKEVHQRFDRLEQKIDAHHEDILNKLTVLTNLLKTIMSDGFDTMDFKLDAIQQDLNRIGELLVNGLGAEYLKDFVMAISAIDQLTQINGNRESKIEDNLIMLTTWLTDVAIIKNTNGAWALPNELSKENVFSFENLRTHQKIIGDELSTHLGYLAKLAMLSPGMENQFNGVDPNNLPNISLFVQGVESYLKGRMHLGSTAAKILDPDNKSIDKIKSTAEKCLDFMNFLSFLHEKPILGNFINLYEASYNELIIKINAAASDRLTTGKVPGFEFPIADTISPTLTWPSEITAPEYPNLSFAPVLTAIQQAKPSIQRLIQKTLSLGIGSIKAAYTFTNHPAKRDCQNFDDWKANHWKIKRGATFNVEVFYEINGQKLTLFTTSGLAGSNRHAETGTIRSKHGTRHHEIGKQYDGEVATENNEAIGTFLNTVWPLAALSAAADYSAHAMSEDVKATIITEIVSKHIAIAPAGQIHITSPRYIILKEILKQPTLLGDYPAKLGYIKMLMGHYVKLTGRSDFLYFYLWDEKKLSTLEYLVNIPPLKNSINSVKSMLGSINVATPKATHPIIHQLRYCSALIEAVKQHEILTAHQSTAELAEDLQVEESIVFDASRIECEQTKANKLGTGSFGQVYRGTDKLNNQTIAVKVLFSGSSLQNEARGELAVTTRLGQEAHPSKYLVHILGVTRLQDRQAIVMEYIDNGNLEEHLHLKEEKLDWDHANSIGKEMIDGMAYLHSCGITHGDFKSANVLLTSDYHVKISDYGLSQVLATTQRASTRARDTQAQVGTVAYRAPELIKNGKLRPTQQSDVYALGIVLWEMLTREIPFKENGADYAIISRMVEFMNGGENPFPVVEPVAPEAVSRGFYTRYAQIIQDSMAHTPETRHTAAALSTRLL